MSHAASTPTPAPQTPRPDDPFRIGWREVRRELPDGRTVVEQVPLTLEDALHPQEGDVIVMNTAHNRDWRYLQDVFERRLAGDPHALVLGDCKVLWEDGVHHSPDLAVILGVRAVRESYSQFDVAAEGVRPRLIVEVVSPSTRVNDVETKVGHYHHYRVPLYVIVDRTGDDSPPQLIGYQYTRRQYLPMPVGDDGQLWLEPLGMSLGVRGDRVVAYSGETGQELGDYVAVSAALDAAQTRADVERQRADAAEQQAAAERQRAEVAEHRADAERQRAEAERQRADTERQRAEAAEARLRQLEAEWQARQPPPAPPGP
jgi:Uma2 family endonuclease